MHRPSLHRPVFMVPRQASNPVSILFESIPARHLTRRLDLSFHLPPYMHVIYSSPRPQTFGDLLFNKVHQDARPLWRSRRSGIWERHSESDSETELDRRREWQGLCQKERCGWEGGARGYDCGRHNTKTVNAHTHTVWRTQCLGTTIKQVVCSQNESFRSCRCYQPLRISHRKK